MTPNPRLGPALSRFPRHPFPCALPAPLPGGSSRGGFFRLRRRPDTRGVPHPFRARPAPCGTIRADRPPDSVAKTSPGLLGLRLENSRNGGRLPRPFAGLALELFSSQRCQHVILRAPVVFSVPPFALEPAGPLQPAERRKQRTWAHVEDALADLLDAHGYPVAVHCFQLQR